MTDRLTELYCKTYSGRGAQLIYRDTKGGCNYHGAQPSAGCLIKDRCTTDVVREREDPLQAGPLCTGVTVSAYNLVRDA